ncbi:hypothetical protein AX16_008864 [Volvariella volvacea WC 439]|nr:hypothetical protein AX16_008864 [Volvariella volvacea WC 439]
MDTIEKVEEYLESLEQYFLSSLATVSNEVPNIHEAVNRLWVDISRYGPGMPAFPQVHIPVLGDFQVPPPPPPLPPPPPPSLWARSTNLIQKHPWKVSAIAIGAVGIGILAKHRARASRRRGVRKLGTQSVNTPTARKQVIVLLGGDTPLGLSLIQELENKGYIIIATVSSEEAVESLERSCQGYVKAVVFDPINHKTQFPVFLRSLQSTLLRKFPINAPGDVWAHPSVVPYVHAVICLLTLPSSYRINHSSPRTPFEHLPLEDAYLPYLEATHIAPLRAIQGLLPILRNSKPRSPDHGSNKKIIVCLPSADVRVGVPFASSQAASAVATLRAIEVLRREIDILGMAEAERDVTRNIKVVVAELGHISVNGQVEHHATNGPSPEWLQTQMQEWSASDKRLYGPVYETIMQPGAPPVTQTHATGPQRVGHGVSRHPTDVSVFVRRIVDLVSDGKYRTLGRDPLSWVAVGLQKLHQWIRRDRIFIGAGAHTYTVASYLPGLLLDGLLNLPYFLISIRNALLPTQPFVLPPPPTARGPTTGGTRSQSELILHTKPRPTSTNRSVSSITTTAPSAPAVSSTSTSASVNQQPQSLGGASDADDDTSPPASEADSDISESTSEVDVQSNAEDSVMGEGWTTLRARVRTNSVDEGTVLAPRPPA